MRFRAGVSYGCDTCYALQHVFGHTTYLHAQVDLAAAARAALQRRAKPGSEATTLPGGAPIFAAVPDDGNRVLQEAMPPLQVSCLHTEQTKQTLQAYHGEPERVLKRLHGSVLCLMNSEHTFRVSFKLSTSQPIDSYI